MTRRVDALSSEGYTVVMSDSDPPENASDSTPPPSPSTDGGRDAGARDAGARDKDSRRRRLEGVIPEIIKRAVELGVEKARESPDNLRQFVGDMKLPKEVGHYVFQQIDETKNGLFRVVAKEIRDFLEHTNFAGEVQKLLTTVQFEVNTTIRFTPNDGKDKPADDDANEDGEPGGEDDEGAAPSTAREERTTSLPKPEVKTNVHVRRDERRRRSR